MILREIESTASLATHGGCALLHIIVLIPDKPGELGRLFGEIGEVGVSIEDFQLEHSVAQSVGRGMVSVVPAERPRPFPERRGWRRSSSKEKQMGVVIALDDPSGSGKSPCPRRVARRTRLDAMYRAAA